MAKTKLDLWLEKEKQKEKERAAAAAANPSTSKSTATTPYAETIASPTARADYEQWEKEQSEQIAKTTKATAETINSPTARAEYEQWAQENAGKRTDNTYSLAHAGAITTQRDIDRLEKEREDIVAQLNSHSGGLIFPWQDKAKEVEELVRRQTEIDKELERQRKRNRQFVATKELYDTESLRSNKDFATVAAETARLAKSQSLSGKDDFTREWLNVNGNYLEAYELENVPEWLRVIIQGNGGKFDTRHRAAEVDPNSSYYKQLRQDELDMYNYLYTTQGGEAASRYLENLKDTLVAREQQQIAQEAYDLGKDHPLAASLLAWNPVTLANEGMAAALNYVDPDNTSTLTMRPSLSSQGWQQGAADRITQNIDNKTIKNAISETYNAVGSVARSYSSAVLGPLGLTSTGFTAGEEMRQDVLARGGTTEQSMQAAAVATMAEIVFEMLPFESLLDIIGFGGKEAARPLLRNILLQGGLEAPGEALTELTNILADQSIMGDLSHYEQLVQQYVAQGMSEEDARRQANKDMAKQVGLAGLAGFAVGSISGGIGTGINAIGNAVQNRKEQKAIQAAQSPVAPANPQQTLEQAAMDVAAAQQQTAPQQTPATADARLAEAAQQIAADQQRASQPQQTVQPVNAPAPVATQQQERAKATQPVSAAPVSQSEASVAPAQSTRQRSVATALPAVDNASGDNITVTGVDSVKDGDVYLSVTTADGTTEVLPVSEVTLSKADADVVYSFGAEKGYAPEVIETMVDHYNPEVVNAENYTAAFDSVYRTARGRIDQATAFQNSALSQHYLTADARQAAYNAGAASVQVAPVAVAEETTVSEPPTAGSNQKYGLVREYTASKLNKEARESLKAHRNEMNLVDHLARRYKTKVVMVDKIEGKLNGRTFAANGRYDPNTNTIYVAADAQEGSFAYVTMHELSHQIKRNNAKDFDRLAKVVFEALKKNGQDPEALIKYQMDAFGHDRDGAIEEVVCNTLPSVLTDEAFVTKLLQEDRTLFERIAEFISDLLDTLRELTSHSRSWQQDAVIIQDRESIAAIAKLFDEVASKPDSTNAAQQDMDVVVAKDARPTTAAPAKLSAKNRFRTDDKNDIEVYNKRRWAVESGIVDSTEYADFLEHLGSTRSNAPFSRTKEGYYIVPVGHYNGINNVVFVTDADRTDPTIYRIYRIDQYNETDLERTRRTIDEYEQEFGASALHVVEMLFEPGFVIGTDSSDFTTYRSGARAFGRNAGSTRGTNFADLGEALGRRESNQGDRGDDGLLNYSAKDTRQAVYDARTAERMHEGRLRAEERRKASERISKVRQARDAKLDEQQKKYTAEIAALKALTAERLAETKEHYEARIAAAQINRELSEETAKYRQRITAKTKTLTAWLSGREKNHVVPEALREPVNKLVQSVDFAGDTKNGALWRERLIKLNEAMQRAAAADAGDGGDYTIDIDPDLIDRVTAYADSMESVQHAKDMTVQQLKQLDEILKDVKSAVASANTMLIDGKRQQIADFATAVIDRAEDKASTRKHKKSAKGLAKLLKSGNITPPYFFHRLGGTMDKLYQDIVAGQRKYAQNAVKARDFYSELLKKYHVAKWRDGKNNTLSFTTSHGDNITLSRMQALALYATAKREESNKDMGSMHLEKGGFVYADAVAKEQNGKKKPKEEDLKPHQLAKEDMDKIRGWLTAEQKAYADAVVEYMSRELSRLGNETSMAMYGIKKYTEPYYYPFRTPDTYTTTNVEASSDNSVRWKNKSFTKSTTKGASSPVVLEDFDAVFASHANEMLMYNAMTIPQENLLKVINWRQRGTEDTAPRSVKTALGAGYGKEATEYVVTFLRDLNGQLSADPRERVLTSGISKMKKGAVLGSLSVAIQQPSAIVRSMALINPKYYPAVYHKGAYKEAMRHSGTAVIKNIGGFDTSTGRGSQEWIISGEKEHVVDNVLGWAPQVMDELTWGNIWVAVKNEMHAKHPKMDMKSAEFLALCGERFDYVINATQVYDSVLARSEFMRSKTGLAQMATAFGAEPTVAYNMLYDALASGRNGIAKPGRALAALYGSIIFNSILKSFVYAARDRDEDETYWEKYLESLTNSLLGSPLKKIPGIGKYMFFLSGDLSPLTMIPMARDVMSMLEGYDVERTDMSVFADLIDAIDAMDSTTKSLHDKWSGLVGSVAALFGVPVKNITRELYAGYSIIAKAMIEDPGQTTIGWKNAIKRGVGLDGLNSYAESAQTAYDAAVAGEKDEYQRVYDLLIQRKLSGMDPEKYVDEDAMRTAAKQDIDQEISKLLKTNDLVHKAYKARTAADTQALNGYYRQLKAMGFGQDVITRAINAYAKQVEGKGAELEDPDDRPMRMYDNDDLVEAARNAAYEGDMDSYRTIYNEAIEYSSAEDPVESVQSKIRSELKEDYLDAYHAGDTHKMSQIEDFAIAELGRERDDLTKWLTSDINPRLYDAVSNGDILATEAAIEELRELGKSDSTIKGSLTREFKPLYLQYVAEGDLDAAAEIAAILTELDKSDGKPMYTDKSFEDWLEEAEEDEDD